MERLISTTADEQPVTSPGNASGGVLEERASLAQRGRRLEYFTIAWNLLEWLIAIVSGALAGSIALVGFGFDGLIEVTSGAALLWRLSIDVNEEKRERIEAITLRIVGICFLALAAYVTYDSGAALLRREPPQESLPGIILAIASLIAMPLLARAKRRVAKGINSGSMFADEADGFLPLPFRNITRRTLTQYASGLVVG
ncbi:MAG TPA: cation transporter [Blastocatellia bacterium]|jgi:divalent metal cation (Fe/Co/Zn/Cd) transporter|nr:cation transporter [Blastocatellia bacterium]